MKTLDPGHKYIVELYPAREEDGRLDSWPTTIPFRKRIGEGYPGNTGRPYNGTTTQELLRVIIARTVYVNNQDYHSANVITLLSSRHSIYELEHRAAQRRGPDYFKQWLADMEEWGVQVRRRSRNSWYDVATTGYPVEELAPCSICGHVFCSGAFRNQRFVEKSHVWHGEKYYWAVIKTGEGGGPDGESGTTFLNALPIEFYRPGDIYRQQAEEVRASYYNDGTVTINDRRRREDGEHARVFWPYGEGWVDAEPRQATLAEVDRVIKRARKVWDDAE